jgi:dihydroorotate dehydrogenase
VQQVYLRALMYKWLRQLLFQFDAEAVHHFAMNSLRNTPFSTQVLQSLFHYQYPSLQRELFGLHFNNPVGLGAGFDKNALYLRELAALGFGFVEVGTVTPMAQPGNDKPRLFRLPGDKALINRMGFNNDGAETIKRRLLKWKTYRLSTVKPQLIVGGNIGKNKITPNENAWKDYVQCFTALRECVDYFVVNVSSPNTPGLRELQEKDALRKIFGELQNINQKLPAKKPLLLKIAPDLTDAQLDDIVSLAFEMQLDGLVATNTTISRDHLSPASQQTAVSIGAGGLSGKPLTQRSKDVVKYLATNTQGKIPIIASGGIFTGKDAAEKLQAGASLIQVWTGFIYEGPAIVNNICRHLAA